MPRVIIGASSSPRLVETLAQQLAQELSSPGDQAQPLIIERHIAGTRSRHIWVVWEGWRDLEAGERTAVITDAYGRSEGFDAADNISIAVGVLPEEAAALGLLPWAVTPANPLDIVSIPYQQAQSREARHTVLGSWSPLRYASEGEARLAIDRLRQGLPGSSWVAKHETDQDDRDERDAP